MAAESWTIAEAKARFGELIDRANRNGPQTITGMAELPQSWFLQSSGKT